MKLCLVYFGCLWSVGSFDCFSNYFFSFKFISKNKSFVEKCRPIAKDRTKDFHMIYELPFQPSNYRRKFDFNRIFISFFLCER